MIAYFKSLFLLGVGADVDAQGFFDQVADKAWHGDLAAKMLSAGDGQSVYSRLAPEHRQRRSLRHGPEGSAAAQAPDRVANIAVKAIHDVLNRTASRSTTGPATRPGS